MDLEVLGLRRGKLKIDELDIAKWKQKVSWMEHWTSSLQPLSLCLPVIRRILPGGSQILPGVIPPGPEECVPHSPLRALGINCRWYGFWFWSASG